MEWRNYIAFPLYLFVAGMGVHVPYAHGAGVLRCVVVGSSSKSKVAVEVPR